MTSRQVCLVALSSLLILSMFIDSTQSASCCLNYFPRRIPCSRLLDYSVQNINTSCDLEAVIFHIQGKMLCADPAAKATQMGIRCIENRRQKATELLKGKPKVSA